MNKILIYLQHLNTLSQNIYLHSARGNPATFDESEGRLGIQQDMSTTAG
jgi:hypothetical protein